MRRLDKHLGRLAIVLVLSFSPIAAHAGSTPQTTDLTQHFVAGGIRVNDLRVLEVGGIVMLRGITEDETQARAASALARDLGYTRVANLIRIVGAPDDAKIERIAERQLATRVLDGCTFHVDSRQGVVTVDGRVRYELQKDVALRILRRIDGVRAVRASIER